MSENQSGHIHQVAWASGSQLETQEPFEVDDLEPYPLSHRHLDGPVPIDRDRSGDHIDTNALNSAFHDRKLRLRWISAVQDGGYPSLLQAIASLGEPGLHHEVDVSCSAYESVSTHGQAPDEHAVVGA
jgi:hypothetical protein